MNSTEFSGKAAFITGAGSGIGAATAVLLAERGAQVAVFGRRKDKLDEVTAHVSSVFADRGGPSTDYSSAKHAIRGLTRTTAKDYAARGILLSDDASYITGAHLAVDGGFLA